MVDQLNLCDLAGWSGKTYQEPSAATVEKISKPSSRKSSASSVRNAPMCLCLKTESGAKQDACTTNWADGALLGEYTTHSFGEYPREENGSRLSQILEECAPQRFFLSARACQGILNRAKRRGKELPPELKQALEHIAFRNEPENQGGARESLFREIESGPCQPSTTKAFSIQGNTIDHDAKQNGGGISYDVAHTINSVDRHGVATVGGALCKGL